MSSLYFGFSLQLYLNSQLVEQFITKLADELHILILPALKTCYLAPKDESNYKTYIKINNLQVANLSEIKLHLVKEEEFRETYQPYLESLQKGYDNFLKNLYEYKITIPQLSLPVYKPHPADYLRDLCIIGLTKKLKAKTIPDIYFERLKKELQVIDEMGFNDYFLITFDFVRWARLQGIWVGPGRGSSVGSLVAYSIGITNIDPLKYNLLFERFLNPLRQKMPDIDVDFEDVRRDEVIQYVMKKYGATHAIQIGTFSRFGFRSAIRDLQRVLNLDEALVKRTISGYEAGDLEKEDLEAHRLVEICQDFLDLPRHSGTHASGVIIAKEDLSKVIPLVKANLGLQSQVEASYLENIGLVKMDFLSLSNLSFLKDIVRSIPNFNLDNLALDDFKTYELLSRMETDDIFQFESPGMKRLLGQLKPRCLEDISCALALFRPGPLANLDNFIKARNSGLNYNTIEILNPTLASTYGIPIYQEQIMEIARIYAGFSLFESDCLRSAMSKKNLQQMASLEADFLVKCQALNRPSEESRQVFALIEKFAAYGFNKSHSMAYALVAYQLAYLKANYYLNFTCVLLQKSAKAAIQSKNIITNLILAGYQVLSPSLFYSTDDYYLNQLGQLVLPLSYVNLISKGQAKDLLSIKAKIANFTIENFFQEALSVVSVEGLVNLISAGALDSFNLTHKAMNNILSGHEFNRFLPGETPNDEYSWEQLQQDEKAAIGHNFKYLKYHNNYQFKNEAKIQGQITSLRTFKTKKGDSMASLTFDDELLNFEIIVFPKVYSLSKAKLVLRHDLILRVKRTNTDVELIEVLSET
jgi:DNA polymerase-3 subunit alpha